MGRASRFRLACVAALLLGSAGPALATYPLPPPQTPVREACEREAGHRLKPGRQGKDVIWARTPDEFVDRMLRMARTTADDYVIDLGAGDGNFAIAAAGKFGARSLGIEYDPELVKLAQCMVRGSGAGGRARVVEGDVFREDFSKADVLTIFLLPHLNQCLRHRILAMRPGVRVVSYQFPMGDWEPDDRTTMEMNVAFLWIVPARVGGRWAFRQLEPAGRSFTVDLTQIYQKIGGEVTIGERRYPLLGAALHGDEIRFAFRDAQGVHQSFSGRLGPKDITGELRAADGGSIELTGTLQGAPHPAPWAAMDPKCGLFYGR